MCSFFQTSRLYFVTGVPSNTVFGPRTKCEIRDIQWFPLDSLPSSKKDPIPDGLGLTYNSLYMVMPFIRLYIMLLLVGSNKLKCFTLTTGQRESGWLRKSEAEGVGDQLNKAVVGLNIITKP
jgi:hypothetical protein